jgi:hypothetical protein
MHFSNAGRNRRCIVLQKHGSSPGRQKAFGGEPILPLLYRIDFWNKKQGPGIFLCQCISASGTIPVNSSQWEASELWSLFPLFFLQQK